jgi:hypothetical protein
MKPSIDSDLMQEQELEADDHVRALLRYAEPTPALPSLQEVRLRHRGSQVLPSVSVLAVLAVVVIAIVVARPDAAPAGVGTSSVSGTAAAVVDVAAANSCPSAPAVHLPDDLKPAGASQASLQALRSSTRYPLDGGGALLVQIRHFTYGLPLSRFETITQVGSRVVHVDFHVNWARSPSAWEGHSWWREGSGNCQIVYLALDLPGASQTRLHTDLLTIAREMAAVAPSTSAPSAPQALSTRLAGLELGMSPEAVIATMGEPVERVEQDKLLWRWAQSWVTFAGTADAPGTVASITTVARGVTTAEGFRSGGSLTDLTSVYAQYPQDIDRGSGDGQVYAVTIASDRAILTVLFDQTKAITLSAP